MTACPSAGVYFAYSPTRRDVAASAVDGCFGHYGGIEAGARGGLVELGRSDLIVPEAAATTRRSPRSPAQTRIHDPTRQQQWLNYRKRSSTPRADIAQRSRPLAGRVAVLGRPGSA